ncbi:hypothetical protein [Streptosporangium sandarakinum]
MTSNTRNEPKKTEPVETEAAKEVQHVMDIEARQGFRGVEVDPTPNSAYTIAGVLGGEPTPETDRGKRREVEGHLDELSKRP